MHLLVKLFRVSLPLPRLLHLALQLSPQLLYVSLGSGECTMIKPGLFRQFEA